MFIWRGLSVRSRRVESKDKPMISVIIPCRNEEDNINRLFESLSKQTYPAERFEIIFVDDSSDDNTVNKIKKLLSGNVKLVHAESDEFSRGHKKHTVERGVSVATGEIIVTTDADCIVPPKWLELLAAEFDEFTGFVAGPVKILHNNSFFSKVESLEFGGLMLAGAGLIKAGFPATCSAANIAYRKKVFEDLGGYSGLDNLSSGDDELLMQKIDRGSKFEVRFLWDEDAVVSTSPKNNVGEFYQQRKRWASKGLFYKNPVLILVLILLYFFFLSLVVTLPAAFLNPFAFNYFITAFLSKLLVDFLVIYKGINMFYDRKLLLYFLPGEIIHAPYIVITAFMGLFGNFKWKDRSLER